jgi:putative ABC transport system permease protein
VLRGHRLTRIDPWRERDRRRLPLADAVLQDVRQAIRVARSHAGFTAVAMLTLALGIGSVAIIYSVVRQILLDPFPYAHSDRMVDVVVRDTATSRILRGALPASEFLDYQEQSTVFEDVLGTIVESRHYVSDAGADRLDVALVTPNMFTFLGVRPLLGREFGPDDARLSSPPVAVLNHRTWTSKFGADPTVVGRTIRLNGEPRTIVGIMPPRFEWNVGDLWIPVPLNRADPKAGETRRWFQARLRKGITVEEAEAQMNVIARRRAADYPQEYPPQSRIQVITVIDWVVGRFRPVLYTLFAAVGLLLVIACCNVANMLLARASAREREMTIRAAVGASRARIVRQLLAESLLLSLGGAVAGCLLAYGGIRALAVWMPRQNVPWETQLRLDQHVLAFALATAAISTLIFGVFPALQCARRDLVSGTGAGERSSTSSRRQGRLRNSLVVAEVALSVVLLLGAGVLMRSFVALVGVDLGFDPRSLLHAAVAFAPGTYSTSSEQQRFYRQALDRLITAPGVLSASVSSGIAPFGGMESPLVVPGSTPVEAPTTLVRFCSERYRDTIGLRLVAGRDLSAADVDGFRKVAVVNETFAKRYFGGQNPLGRPIALTRLAKLPTPVADPTFEIVGVVQDVVNTNIREPPAPEAYVPFPFRGPGSLGLLLRTSADPLRLANTVRQEIRAIDREVAVPNIDTLENLMQRFFYAQPRFVLIVLGMFAVTGLVLVALGIYGVLAYTVSQRTREIAIRLAIGGEHHDVLRLVLGLGLRLVAIGVVIGLLASTATNRLLISQLWNTSPHDILTLAAVATTIVIIGLGACWVPARRAMRVDPMVALRQE